jgi:hypothetical protein
MLDQAAAAQSTVIGLQGEITLLRYLQMDRGLRPDVRLLDARPGRRAAGGCGG